QSSHTYASAITSPTQVSVQVLDEGGSGASGSSSSFTVAATQLKVNSVNAPPSPVEGVGTGNFTVATFTDVKTSEPAGNFTAIVSWGDGTTSNLTSANGISGSNGSFVVQASHTYPEQFTTATVVSVQILDSTGPTATGASASF